MKPFMPQVIIVVVMMVVLVVLGGMFSVGFQAVEHASAENPKDQETLYQLQGCRVSLERRNAMLAECVDLLESSTETRR